MRNLVRAAASSIESGRPSRRRQISATAAVLVRSTARSGRTTHARSRNSSTAGAPASAAVSLSLRGGTGRGPRTSSCSHDNRSETRLVTRSLSSRRRRDQLREQRRGLGQMLEAVEHEQDRAAAEAVAKRRQIVADTRDRFRRARARSPRRRAAGSATASSGTNVAPSTRSGASRRAASTATRVFPDASGAGDGQQANVVAPERGADVLELSLAADQSIRRRRELGPVDLRRGRAPASRPVSGSPARAASAWGRARFRPAPGVPCARSGTPRAPRAAALLGRGRSSAARAAALAAARRRRALPALRSARARVPVPARRRSDPRSPRAATLRDSCARRPRTARRRDRQAPGRARARAPDPAGPRPSPRRRARALPDPESRAGRTAAGRSPIGSAASR